MSLTAVWNASPLYSEERAKTRGMRVAASAHHTDLRLAREIARELGRDGSEVCADDLRIALAQQHPECLQGCLNYLGSVFKGPGWRFAGYVKSRTRGSHGNRLCSWVRADLNQQFQPVKSGHGEGVNPTPQPSPNDR